MLLLVLRQRQKPSGTHFPLLFYFITAPFLVLFSFSILIYLINRRLAAISNFNNDVRAGPDELGPACYKSNGFFYSTETDNYLLWRQWLGV